MRRKRIMYIIVSGILLVVMSATIGRIVSLRAEYHESRPYMVDVRFPISWDRPLTIQVGFDDVVGTFIIDTGASHGVIDSEFAKRVGIASTAGYDWAIAPGRIRPARSVRLRSDLTIGDERFSDLEWMMLDLHNNSREHVFDTCDGILGRDLLSRLILVLDFIEGSGRLMDRDSFRAESQRLIAACACVPLTRDARVSTYMSGDEYRMLVDTGYNEYFELSREPRSYVRLGEPWFGNHLYTYYITVHGRVSAEGAHVGFVSAFSFGMDLLKHAAATVRPSLLKLRRGLIGLGVLGDGYWIIDLRGRALWYKFRDGARFDRSAASLLQLKLWGSGPDIEHLGEVHLIVTDIHESNPLRAELGMQAGDEIIAVDGTVLRLIQSKDPLTEYGYAARRIANLRFRTLTIIRDGERRILELGNAAAR